MLDHLNAVFADRYHFERELGRGGMASVWLARDLKHDRLVAIKILHPELAGAIGVDRFVREIRVTAGLQHPGIIPVLDSGTLAAPDGMKLPWYSMGYIDGESLRSRLDRDGALPIDEAVSIACDVAAALEAAHRHGVIHRDIKPENILISSGRVCVADFGIAKALMDTGGERLTSTGIVIGTPTYMSPEQAASEPVDARTDQYSLATVLYEMLAGEPPFAGGNSRSIISRRLVEPARSIRTVRASVPEELEATVLRALERVPGDRFASVGEFAAALRNPAPIVSNARGTSRGGSSRKLSYAALLVVLASIAGWLLINDRPPREKPRDPAAQALYERGMLGYARRTPAGVNEAVQAFTAALRIDSTYGEAWSGLAMTYVRAYQRSFVIPGVSADSMLRLAVAASDRALAVDRTSADSWVTQASVRRNVDPTDPVPAVRAARQALAIDSANADAWHFLALSQAELGDFVEAMSAWRKSVKADPGYLQGLGFLSQAHYWLGQHDSAAFWADSAIAVDPNYLLGRTTAGYAAIELGNFSRARAHFDAGRRLSTSVERLNTTIGLALVDVRSGAIAQGRRLLAEADSSARDYHPVPLHTAVYLAHVYAALGQNEQAIDWIKRYSPLEDLHLQIHLRCDPPFSSLAGDPRYRSLLVKSGNDSSRDCRLKR